MTDNRDTFRFLRHGTASAAVAACVPPIVAAATGDPRAAKPTIAIALLGLCTGLAWIAVLGAWHRARATASGPALIITVVMVSFASTIARHPERNWDYLVTYELPAQQLAAGINPYESGETTNPPTWAQVTALAAQMLRRSVLSQATADAVWFWVFYVYQALQLALVAVLLGLVYRVARDAGRPPFAALLIGGIAMVICSPLQESLHLNQLNLLVLVLTMAAVLLGARHPLLAGVAAGFGGAVKLYPFGAGLLWLVRGQLRPIVATGVVAVVVAMAGWSGWELYVGYLQDFDRPAIVRDASLHSIAANLTRAATGVIDIGDSSAATASFLLWVVLDLAVIVWVLRRQRSGRGSQWEIVAALPLLFPLAWVHHYLLVLPLGVARFSATGLASRTAAAGGLLALVLPAFDTFPLGLARPIGTLLLLAAAEPEREQLIA